MDDVPKGRPLAIDATAQSASPTEPAFIARPEGAPVYYGFVVLDDVVVDLSHLARSPISRLSRATREMRS
jgi:hypothetical protein